MRIKTGSPFILLGILVISCSDDIKPPIISVDEGIYINELYASGDDWLELYNSNSTAKNIGGYYIYDDPLNKYFIPLNTIVPPGGYLVFNCNDLAVGLNTNFKLTSAGETVYFENNSDQLADQVTFPGLTGSQSYARFPDGGVFSVTGTPTQGTSNGTSQAPVITEISRAPLIPLITENAVIQAKVIDASGLTTVKLFYRVDGSSFNELSMAGVGSNNFQATIPANTQTGQIEYYIEAKNTLNVTSVFPLGAPSDLLGYLLNTDPLPPLFINEFMAFSSACCPDIDSGSSEFDDWIEVYNNSGSPVNIAGMYLSDDKTNPFKWKVPATDAPKTTIPANGFLIVWADEQGSQGVLHASFQLSNAGEDVGIYYIDGRKMDEYTFVGQTENTSRGRSSNGGATWATFSAPTPGSSNN